MEYRVTMAIFDALLDVAPEMRPVMGETLPNGPTEYVLGLDADDVLSACTAAIGVFRSAVLDCDFARAADAAIIDVHAERVPDWELQQRSELQTT
jgi:hypothetical protein